MRADDLERLFSEHAQPLFGFLAYRLGDRSAAEDLVVDTFERALRARRRFDPRRGSEKSWLYAIALNVLRDHQRRAAAQSRALERSGQGALLEAPDAGLEQVEHRATMAGALERLSEDEREAVALRFGLDLTVPEMAKLLGEPLTTMEGRVYRALRRLREDLG